MGYNVMNMKDLDTLRWIVPTISKIKRRDTMKHSLMKILKRRVMKKKSNIVVDFITR